MPNMGPEAKDFLKSVKTEKKKDTTSKLDLEDLKKEFANSKDILSEEEIDNLVNDDKDDSGRPIVNPIKKYYDNVDKGVFFKYNGIFHKNAYFKNEYKFYKIVEEFETKIDELYNEGKFPPTVYIKFMRNQLQLLGSVLRYFWKNTEIVNKNERMELEEKELKEVYFLLKNVINKLDTL